MDQICTLNQLGRKVYVGFMEMMEMASDSADRESLG